MGRVQFSPERSTADKIIYHFYRKKMDFFSLYVARESVICSTLSSKWHFFCQLLESSLARINLIRAVYQFRVEQLICCQKCRANACRAIAIRAVHPHSLMHWKESTYKKFWKLEEPFKPFRAFCWNYIDSKTKLRLI